MPAFLSDYDCPLSTTSSPDQLASVLTYDHLSPEHKSFGLSVELIDEPQHYSEVVRLSEWRTAMSSELQALESTNTWTVFPLPLAQHAIGCTWIYKVNYKSNGSNERYKARLMAKGFTQQLGMDYVEALSPVVKMTTFKLVLGVAAAKGWHVHQLDMNHAFLHGDLLEEVYMYPPLGYKVPIIKLNRSLYSLKQASRQRNAKLTLYLSWVFIKAGMTIVCLSNNRIMF